MYAGGIGYLEGGELGADVEPVFGLADLLHRFHVLLRHVEHASETILGKLSEPKSGRKRHRERETNKQTRRRAERGAVTRGSTGNDRGQ